MTQKADSHNLDKALCSKAVGALLKYHEKQVNEAEKEQLFGTDAVIHAQFNLEVPPAQRNPKPIRLVIPNEIYKLTEDSAGMEEPDVCLIVKDDAKPWLLEMIEKFPEYMGNIKKVLTLSSLRSKHNEYKQRRELLKRFDVFMADTRIVPMLMKALGKRFWEAGKQPIPIRITRKEGLPHMIRVALKSTYMTLNTGHCTSAKCGFTGMEPEKIVQNILTVAEKAADKIPRGWANIRSIGIKTHNSTLLPIYNKTPAELEEIARLAGLPPVYVDDDEMGQHEDDDDDDDDETKDEESAAEKEAKRKREAETKSPLLKALKKQKKLEKKESLENTEKKHKKASDDSPKGKRSRATSIDEGSTAAEGTPPEKKKRTEEKSPSTTKKAKKAKQSEGGVDSDTKKAEKKKKTKSLESKSEESDMKKDFIASKKFTGSKKGFVFKKGPKGLGYYIDSKPVVDELKVEAMLRSARKSANKRGSGEKRKGRRAGRW